MGGCLCAYTGLHRGKEWRPLSHGTARPRCPSSTGNLGERGCPRLLSLLSTCQWRTSVLPSSGGEQPVTVGSLWIQQAAFVSPNSDMLQKATEWAGDWFLGREPPALSTMVGRGNCIYAPGPMPMCALFESRAGGRAAGGSSGSLLLGARIPAG